MAAYIRVCISLLAAFMMSAGLVTTAGATHESKDPLVLAARSARPLTAEELRGIYGDQSWIWKDGAGFFALRGREFSASVKDGSDASYAKGRWFVTDSGKLCFRADWSTIYGDRAATSCFEHRTDSKRIFQRRLPNGKWYIFANAPRRADDEIQKVRKGDYVAPKLDQTARDVQRNMIRRDCSSAGVFEVLCHIFRP